MSHDDPIAAAADVLAAHIDIGREGHCRCGWRQRAFGATFLHEHRRHQAQALADANLLAGDDAVRAVRAAWEEGWKAGADDQKHWTADTPGYKGKALSENPYRTEGDDRD